MVEVEEDTEVAVMVEAMGDTRHKQPKLNKPSKLNLFESLDLVIGIYISIV